jgi:hypothetical protein
LWREVTVQAVPAHDDDHLHVTRMRFRKIAWPRTPRTPPTSTKFRGTRARVAWPMAVWNTITLGLLPRGSWWCHSLEAKNRLYRCKHAQLTHHVPRPRAGHYLYSSLEYGQPGAVWHGRKRASEDDVFGHGKEKLLFTLTRSFLLSHLSGTAANLSLETHSI